MKKKSKKLKFESLDVVGIDIKKGSGKITFTLQDDKPKKSKLDKAVEKLRKQIDKDISKNKFGFFNGKLVRDEI